MNHQQAIHILREKSDKDEYLLPDNRIDNKKVLDDYYSLLTM